MVAISKYFKDARHFQILFLGSFLLLSFLVLDRDDFAQCTIVISAALLLQFLFLKYYQLPISSLKSALITALGLCLLLKTNHLYTSLFAVAIAISSKFLIRYKGKHLFNPVNIGIVLTIFLTQDAWISPGQWGSSGFILFVLSALGLLVLTAAERLDITLTFILTFGGLLFIKNILYLDWPMDFWLHQMTNGTLMLFTFFMITDPMTTPNHRKGRIIYAIAIAVISFILSSELYFYTAPIYVLFAMSLITPLADRIWKAKKYQWNSHQLKTHLQ